MLLCFLKALKICNSLEKLGDNVADKVSHSIAEDMEFNFGTDDSLGDDSLTVEDDGGDDQVLDSEENMNVFKEMMEGIECDDRVGW